MAGAVYSYVLAAPLLLALPAAVVVLVVLSRTARPDADLGPMTAAARRHAVTGAVLAATTAVLVAGGVVALGNERVLLETGRFISCAFLVAGIAHTVVLAITELTWPRPQGTRRTVPLLRRTARDVVSRPMLLTATASVAGLAAAAVAGGLLADTNGGSLSRGLDAGGLTGTATAGPFPGWYYSGPVLSLLGVLVALVPVATALVVWRPAVSGAGVGTDTALRRASAHRVLRGAAAAAALTLGPLLAVAGYAVHSIGGQARDETLSVAGMLIVLAGGIVSVLGLALPLVPAPRVPSAARTERTLAPAELG